MKYVFTIILINIALTIIIGVFFFYPRYEAYSDAAVQAANKKKEIKDYQSYLNKIKLVKEEIERNKILMDKVASAIPNKPEISSFLDFLSNNNMGVSLEDIMWSEEYSKKEKIATSYRINAHIAGSYFSLKNFFYYLENTARLVEILNTDIEAPETGNENEQMNCNLVLRIYSY